MSALLRVVTLIKQSFWSLLYVETSSLTKSKLPKRLAVSAINFLCSKVILILLSLKRNTSGSFKKALPSSSRRKIVLRSACFVETSSLENGFLPQLRAISAPILQKSTFPNAGASGTPQPKINLSPQSSLIRSIASHIISPRLLPLNGIMQQE